MTIDLIPSIQAVNDRHNATGVFASRYPDEPVTLHAFALRLQLRTNRFLHGCGTEFPALPTQADYTTLNEDVYEALLVTKDSIQTIYNDYLMQVQKPQRAIDKLSKQYVDVRDSAKNNTKNGLTDAATNRLAALTKEMDGHRAVSGEWKAKFMRARAAEEYFRHIPAAYKAGTAEAWLEAYSQMLLTEVWASNL